VLRAESQAIIDTAAPLLKWLAEAEVEESDNDDDDEVTVCYLFVCLKFNIFIQL
jgi:hypothetical protein